jgi:uncharacterized protein YacL (UPF0231 family)
VRFRFCRPALQVEGTEISYSESGYPEAETFTPHNILGRFLESDVLSNEDTTKYLLSVVEDVKITHEEYEQWGNGYVLNLVDGKAVIWHIGYMNINMR